ncbi:MAG TPA: PepSY-associated TM helix domain-containing protein [Caulobacteraceae bacterium]|nr:PepSY-associated TM helix domain-containing protein [Caulobacteraceae bacterium]
MKTVHRFIAVLAVFLGLYVGCTGTLLQLVDLKTLLKHEPATDANLESIREGHDGPPNFDVIVTSDFAAPSLPINLNFDSALATVVRSDRAVTNGAAMKFVELRMLGGKPVGLVWTMGKLLRFDATTGAVLAGPDTAPAYKLPPLGNQGSFRNQVKGFHRMTAWGVWGQIVFVGVALVLAAMILSGVWLYCQLWIARSRIGRPQPFWSAGGLWRTLHRGVATVAGIFLVVVVLSGTFEAINSGGSAMYTIVHGGRPGLKADVSSPLTDAGLPPMLHTTLTAFNAVKPNTAIKVLRLRYFAGMPQGIVVAGGPDDTQQWAFNAATGGVAPLAAASYPPSGQTFGWQWDQIMKGIHRGDFIGLSGRMMSLLSGLSLIFLSASGAVMYVDLWAKRRKLGRNGLFWV